MPGRHLRLPRHASDLDTALAGLPSGLPRPTDSRSSRKHRYLAFGTAAQAVAFAAALRERGIVDISFDAPAESPAECSEAVPPVLLTAGLRIVRGFVSEDEEVALLQAIDASEWDTSIHRQTQHYGTRFDYGSKSYDRLGGAPALPCWLRALAERLLASGSVPWRDGADQVTVNEYLPGMGIAPHIDTHSAFEDGIAALSLGSGCAMRLSRLVCFDGRSRVDCASGAVGEAIAGADEVVDGARTLQSQPAPGDAEAGGVDEALPSSSAEATLWLPPRSLIVFSGASRYEWAHGIPMRKGDVLVGGQWTPRDRRVSITFRRVLRGGCSCAYPQMCDSQGGASVALPTRLQA
jgi:alkylated DNA repair protein alkB family protein 8